MSASDPAGDVERASLGDADVTIRRLERRLERERNARTEAERIAEEGMRSLFQANRELDNRILERTAELHEALAVAEAANTAKSDFLAQMGHQLNTPLNGLLGMLELLGPELADDRARRWHGSAMRSSRRLERLVKRMITYAEFENVDDLRRRCSPVSVPDLLASVHDRWHAEALRAGQLLSVEMRPGVNGEVAHCEALDLMFDELVSNAIEHAGPGGVTILAQPGDPTGYTRIDVLDPGPGFDRSLLEDVHELAADHDQSRRADRPISLGLALVDRIVAAMGTAWGPVRVEGRAGVSVTLPPYGA